MKVRVCLHCGHLDLFSSPPIEHTVTELDLSEESVLQGVT